MAPALRLHDPRTGGLGELPRRPLLRIGVTAGDALRPMVTADLLRRVARRLGHTVITTAATDRDWSDYNVPPVEAGPLTETDVRVAPAADDNGLCLVVPPETGDWDAALEPLSARLAVFEARYREPLEITPVRHRAAAARLDRWRELVAQWAGSPGRPMHRGYVAEAEAALAEDLDSPAALAVLERIAADPDMAPGAKVETFIHIDLMLGLDVVRDIGRR